MTKPMAELIEDVNSESNNVNVPEEVEKVKDKK